MPRPLKKLVDRRVEGVPPDRLRTTDLAALLDPYLRMTSASSFEFNTRRDRLFSKALIRWGTQGADTVCSMMGEGWDFLVGAKERGLRVALDVFCIPITHRIIEAERKMFPGWEQPDTSPYDRLEEMLDGRFRLADVLLCPSPQVVEGLRAYPSFDAEKIRLVPYPHTMAAVSRENSAETHGKVLFGGAAVLGKGIHYYCKAAEILARAGERMEFLAAGPASELARNRPEAAWVRFLGPLPRPDFLKELRSSSVFVLPTLAEGSAGVISEALCSGVPVVTTRSAGSAVTDGKEGRIVPERDPEALAGAIREIVSDRELRASMSAQALRTAADYTEDRWQETLVRALQPPRRY
jgi:glycosyltransferase involved in cell wall biosynthesis